ncbi:pyocin knob domain-containing protein, partial [Photorhabdus luminescens]|uniref:pyocin knob domain-containing protein n=1 Tax=Photorhabdus luminescens TaxID=29488 RepID=UPI001F02DA3A
MQKIGDITNTADKNGEFTNGNVAAGIAPTILDAGWFNTVQRELINAILGAGIKLDSKNDSQLFIAIKKLIDNSAVEIHDASLTQKGITQLTDKTGNSNTLAATQKLVTDVNDNANSKLAKNQNGADIPDKNAFVKNLGLSETVTKANNAVPSSRKINGKALSGDVNITSQDIFDEPITIPDKADLNTYRTGGIYYQPSSA